MSPHFGDGETISASWRRSSQPSLRPVIGKRIDKLYFCRFEFALLSPQQCGYAVARRHSLAAHVATQTAVSRFALPPHTAPSCRSLPLTGRHNGSLYADSLSDGSIGLSEKRVPRGGHASESAMHLSREKTLSWLHLLRGGSTQPTVKCAMRLKEGMIRDGADRGLSSRLELLLTPFGCRANNSFACFAAQE